MVSGAQLADGDVAGAGTAGATGAHQRTRRTGGGILGYLIRIVVTLGIGVIALVAVATGAAGVGGITLGRTGGASHLGAVAVRTCGTTSRTFAGAGGPAMALGIGVVVLIAVRTLGTGVGGITLSRTGGVSHLAGVAVAGGGDGFGLGGATVVTGVGLDTCLGTRGRSGHRSAVPLMGAGHTHIITPGAAGISPAGNTEAVLSIGGQGQVSSLVPLSVPVVLCAAGVHADENHIGITGSGGRALKIAVTQIGHCNPFFAGRSAEEIGFNTCVVRFPSI